MEQPAENGIELGVLIEPDPPFAWFDEAHAKVRGLVEGPGLVDERAGRPLVVGEWQDVVEVAPHLATESVE